MSLGNLQSGDLAGLLIGGKIAPCTSLTLLLLDIGKIGSGTSDGLHVRLILPLSQVMRILSLPTNLSDLPIYIN